MALWDPQQYQRFGDERARPFFDLVGRISASDPTTVVDLGCGPGNLTATLAERWQTATVEGVDNDSNMLAAAQQHSSARVRFSLGDVTTWKPASSVDVLVSNATLQWIPDHLRLMPRFIDALSAHGWLAFQLPGNLDDPHHQAIREVMAAPHWASVFADVPERRMGSYPAVTYLSSLSRLGCKVDTWETSYVHVLQGADPVLEWVKGTALRPVLARLTPAQQPDFLRELADLLRSAYSTYPWGTPLPFRRIFVVAQRNR